METPFVQLCFWIGLNAFQVEEGKEDESQLGCGMNHFLIKGLFPLVWHVALHLLLHQADISSQQQSGSQRIRIVSEPTLLWTHTHIHELKYRNVECGTKVSSMCLLTPDLRFRSCSMLS